MGRVLRPAFTEPNSAGSRKIMGSLWIFLSSMLTVRQWASLFDFMVGMVPRIGGPTQSSTQDDVDERASQLSPLRRLPSELRQDRSAPWPPGRLCRPLPATAALLAARRPRRDAEPLDDLALRPGEDGGGEMIPKLSFEFAVYLGLVRPKMTRVISVLRTCSGALPASRTNSSSLALRSTKASAFRKTAFHSSA